jgi:hypothetical protein
MKSKWQFFWRVTACHMVSYFVFGLIFSKLFNYKDAYTTSLLSSLMRPVSEPIVAAGPMLQIIRGLLFTLILWPLKEYIFDKKQGWLKLWLIFIGFAILGTVGPTPGSIEGLIYTKLPFVYQILGLPEVLLQTLTFSLGLYFWYKRPKKAYNVTMGIFCGLIVLMSLAGVFLRK